MAASDAETGGVRELFNVLRAGDRGVSFEPLAHQLYFLQTRGFTLFDALDAFRSSAGASERYLGYRDFQIAVTKIARFKYASSLPDAGNDALVAASPTPSRTESDLVAALLAEVGEAQALTTRRMDALRRQLARPSVLDMLRANAAKLLQGFELYGTASSLPDGGDSIGERRPVEGITFEGFVDFLNAYFEYEDFFAYSELAQMMEELQSTASERWSAGRAAATPQTAGTAGEMFFMQFLELFCRVASAFHHAALLREGGELRRAIETCRLEFSIDMLLQHMGITLIWGDAQADRAAQEAAPATEAADGAVRGRPADATGQEGADAPRPSVLHEIAAMLASFEARGKSARRLLGSHPPHMVPSTPKRSVLFSRLPPRRSSPTRSQPSSALAATRDTHGSIKINAASSRERPPQVVMIREVVSPPPMAVDALCLVENAIKYQNAGQFTMALSTLDACRAQLSNAETDADDTELRVFLSLLTASVLDSAHKDAQALGQYLEALRTAEALAPDHPARLLVRSCMGCTLFYAGELSLAKQAHRQVLDARRAAAARAADRASAGTAAQVDLATAMHNVACCLSHEERAPAVAAAATGVTGYTPLEEAFLLFREAKRMYAEAFGPTHPRVEVVRRSLEHARSCQVTVVTDARGALERGEYAHVIPGSVFQIRALEPARPPKSGKKGGKKRAGSKKKSK